MLMREAAKKFGWKLNYGAIALMWRGGCIIRRYHSTAFSIFFLFFFQSLVKKFGFWICFLLVEKRFIIHSDLVSRINNLAGYNLPDSYLDIPLSIAFSIFTLWLNFQS